MTQNPQANTVLIVDDENTFTDALREVLQESGLSVSIAHDGVEALRSLETNPSSVVITDLNMPEMGGVELIKEARSRGLSSDFVICTGYPSEMTQREVKQLEVARYFTKPVKLEELMTAVRDLVSEHKSG
ncbi:hypothetical protein SCG7086_AZ_00120 [Chlamydiales bacterium SCGC AG-110-P3]|nr:hypothetical protein SCG7086_AZ_00120 [Chlamydiales bacterium SCGC AG-110-P3]